MGSPCPEVSHTPPKPDHSVSIEIGPSTDAPLVLSKTWIASLTIWTYCVDPTSPSVSGGAQLQETPGNGTPSKLRTGDGIASGARLFWTTGSNWVRTSLGMPSGSRCRWRGWRPTLGGISRRGGETSFFDDTPTVIPEAPDFLLDCAAKPGADAKSVHRTP